jgi:hypothetical protein
MTSTSHNDLIDSIRSLLDGRITSSPPEVVALEYARLCRDVNERLSRIAPMLQEGGEIQALQIAEQPPRLLDLAFVLSFGSEVEWQEYCRAHGHEVAPLIDARVLEQLLAVQEKGVSSNHALYKEYRAAVSTKNDAKAYDLIRIITRLNPKDENAGRELKRLEKKAVITYLSELRQALANQEQDKVLDLIAKLEESTDADAYQQTPEWKAAVLVFQERKRTEARDRMPELLQMAEEKMAEGDWRMSAVWHSEFCALYRMFGGDQDAANWVNRANTLEESLAKHRAEAERKGRAQQLVTEMCKMVDDVEIRAITPNGLTETYCGPILEEMTRKWRMLEELRGEVPAAARARIESTRERLTQSMQRAQGGRRAKRTLITSLAAIVLIAIMAGGYFSYKANDYAKRLKEMRDKESIGAAQSLLAQIQDSAKIFLKHGALATVVAETQQWLETATSSCTLTEKEIKRLEEARDTDFKEISSPELCRKLDSLEKMVAALPADLRKLPETRFAVVKNEAERVMTQRQETSDAEALKTIAFWKGVLQKLDYKGSVNLAEESLRDSAEQLAPLIEVSEFDAPLARLKASTDAELKDLQRNLEKAQQLIGTTKNAIRELENAEDPVTYHTALKTLAEGSFAEAVTAVKVADGWPDEQRLKAFLLFNNDLTALKSVDGDLSGALPMPDTASNADREVLSNLMKHESLNEVWDVEWKTSNGESFKGIAKDVDDNLPDQWSGRIAKSPKNSFEKMKFFDFNTTVNKSVIITASRVSPNASLMAELNLRRLLNSAGTEFNNSIVPVIESVMNAKKAHPLARAYILDGLFRMVHDRERLWGIHYCPELYADMRAFGELNENHPALENSWLLQEKSEKMVVWEQFFSDRIHRSYSANITSMKRAIRLAMRNDVALAGRVDNGGNLQLRPTKTSRLLLGLREDESGAIGLCLLGMSMPDDEEFSPAFKALPLSPILFIDLPEDDQRFIESTHQKSSNNNSNKKNP